MAERVRRRPRAETREQLLDAAARVFAQRGFHGASVESVSAEAGYSTGALYSNFDGKEDLFLTLYEERIQRRRRELRAAAEQAGDRAAALTSAAASVTQALERDSDWFLLYFEFALHAARNADFARRFETVRDEGLAELAEGLAEALERAGLASAIEPADLARVLRALAYGSALDALVDEHARPPALFPIVLRLLFRGLRAEFESSAHGPPDGS